MLQAVHGWSSTYERLVKSQKFFSSYLTQEDLSRLGRDYIEAGKYTDFIFPSLGCRFIALNDGVDTIRKNNEMLVILKNVMNDLYARDTSNKIKAVKLPTFKAVSYTHLDVYKRQQT